MPPSATIVFSVSIVSDIFVNARSAYSYSAVPSSIIDFITSMSDPAARSAFINFAKRFCIVSSTSISTSSFFASKMFSDLTSATDLGVTSIASSSRRMFAVSITSLRSGLTSTVALSFTVVGFSFASICCSFCTILKKSDIILFPKSYKLIRSFQTCEMEFYFYQ